MEKFAHNMADMVLFVEVARAESYQRAALRLNIPVATISRRISAMEKRLGVNLLVRTTRSVALAQSAKPFFEQCLRVVEAGKMAHDLLESEGGPTELLRISMPVDLGVEFLGPMIAAYADQQVRLRIQFDLTSDARDLFRDPVDLVFRIGRALDDRVIARKIGDIQAGLYAAPAILKKYGTPIDPADLTALPCLDLMGAEGPMPWVIAGRRWEKAPGNAAFAANSVGLLRILAEQGLGAALMPVHVASKSVETGRLVPILQNESPLGWPLYALTSSRNASRHTRGLIAYVKERFI